jgi:hypothetical protein
MDERDHQAMMEDQLDLICEKCGTAYQKPTIFKAFNEQFPNVFFEWSLAFCDTCRREKEIDAMKCLPKIIDNLTKQTTAGADEK